MLLIKYVLSWPSNEFNRSILDGPVLGSVN